jgi:VanZ family protein
MIQYFYVAANARLPRPSLRAPLDRPGPVTPTTRAPLARWLPPALWAAALLAATSWPNPRLPAVHAGDKVVHVGLYACLAWLAVRAAGAGAARAPVARVIAAVAAFGAFDEWHQRFIPGRSTSAADWAADLAGAALGALAGAAAARRAGALRA